MRRMFGIAVVAAALGAGPAWAWPGTVDWPTYYRTGPSKQYGVLDELQRGQTFDVLSCEGEWCRVRGAGSEGYVERGALAQGAPPVLAGPPGECVDVRLAGHTVKGQPFRVCRQGG